MLRAQGTLNTADLRTFYTSRPRGYTDYQALDDNITITNEKRIAVPWTKDGRVLTGILVEQDPRSSLLRNANGKEGRLARANVQMLRASGVSLMPEDQMRALTEQRIRDLFSFPHAQTVMAVAIRVPGPAARRARGAATASQ